MTASIANFELNRQNTWYGTLPDKDGTAALVTGDDGYQLIVDENQGMLAIYDMEDGERGDLLLVIMGDPHVYSGDGRHIADLPLDTPVEIELQDGTKVTVEMTPGPNGTAYIKSVFVQKGDNAWLANNVEPGRDAVTVQATSTRGDELAEVANDNTPMRVRLSNDGKLVLASTGREITQDVVDGYNQAHSDYRNDVAHDGENAVSQSGGGGGSHASGDIGDQLSEMALQSQLDDLERNIKGQKKGNGKGGTGGHTGIWGIIAAIAEKVDEQLAKTQAAIDAVNVKDQTAAAKDLAQVQIETAKLGWMGNTWQSVGQNAADAAKKPAEIH